MGEIMKEFMKESISVTRGLVKLKILTKRIAEKTHQLKIITYAVGEKLPIGIVSKEAFKKSAQADFTSLSCLIALRARIKSAIVQINAITVVLAVGAILHY